MENTNLGFSVGYVLCASYVCTWYQPADHSMVPGTYVQYRATSKRTYQVVFFLFERSEFLIATSPKKNLRMFDYVAAAMLAADADAAVLVATMTPPYVR